MSSFKLENKNINNKKTKKSISFENSKIFNAQLRKMEEIPVTTALSNFFVDLTERQKHLQNEIENQRNTIKNADKKIYFLASKMFQNIESKYKKIKLSNKASNSKLNNDIMKNKIKQFEKSRSEIMMKFDDKIIKNNIFQTSINSKKMPIRINLGLISTPKISTSFNNSVFDTKNNNIIHSENRPKNHKLLSLSTPIKKFNKDISTINHEQSRFLRPKYRIKKYKVEVIKGWEAKNGFDYDNSKNKYFIEDKVYQRNFISNQIEIIIDNTNSFKLENMIYIEKHIKQDEINIQFLIKLNKLIEETSGLFIKVGHLIISDYEKFSNLQSETHQLNPPEMKEGSVVYNEKIEFGKNTKILNESVKFLTTTYEVYLILTNTSDYILSMNEFLKIKHFLNRARFNISELNIYSKKCLDIIKYENNIVNLYNSQKKIIQNNEKLINKQYSNIDKTTKDDFENFREKVFQEYGRDKVRRLNNLLNETRIKHSNSKKNILNKKCKFIDFDDRMFNKLFKYMDPEIKDKFEAFSVTQKKNNNKFERKVYKFNF